MGFTKKTWLALALAIVLVLGLAVSASAAVTTVTLSGTQTITTGATPGVTTITATLNEAGVAGGTITLTSSNTNVTIANASQATSTTDTYTWQVTAAKLGTADLTATYRNGTTTVASATYRVTVNPSDFQIQMAGATTYIASGGTAVAKSGLTATTFSVFDTASTPNAVNGASISKTADANGTINTLSTNPTSNTFTIYGGKPGTGAVITIASGGATKTFNVVVTPDEVKLVATDPSIADPYTLTGASASPVIPGTSNVFKVVDSKDNVIEGATFTPATSGVVSIAYGETGESDGGAWDGNSVPDTGLIKVTGGSTIGKSKLTYAWGTAPNNVTGTTTAEFTVLDPLKAQSVAISYKNDTISGTIPFVTIAPADDAKGKAEFKSSGNVYTFKTVITPDGAEKNTVTWTTSTPKVAKLLTREVYKAGDTYVNNWYGTQGAAVATADVGKPKYPDQIEVEFLKAGTAKLTAKVDGVTRTLTFVVTNKAATGIATIGNITMVKNAFRQIKPTMVPAEAPGNFTFTSSKKAVATINKTTGVIKAIKNGTTTITVKDSISKTKTTFTVTVNSDISKIGYRGFALVSSPNNMPWDAYGLEGVFSTVSYDGKTPCKSLDAAVTEETSWDWLKAELQKFRKDSATKPTTDDDIFAFYFSGKVNSAGEIELVNGADNKPTTLKMDDLFAELAKIPGTVFLMMDCNMSSLALTTKGAADLTPAQFNNMVISTAKRKALQSKTIGTAAADAGSYKQKFKVLLSTSKKSQTSNYTSASVTENNVTTTYISRWFTQYLVSGLNPYTMGNMPADANKNKVVTLKELYNYVNKGVKAEVTAYNKANPSAKVKQVVSVYPTKGDAFPVYARVAPSILSTDY